jgi:hypothetical protein
MQRRNLPEGWDSTLFAPKEGRGVTEYIPPPPFRQWPVTYQRVVESQRKWRVTDIENLISFFAGVPNEKFNCKLFIDVRYILGLDCLWGGGGGGRHWTVDSPHVQPGIYMRPICFLLDVFQAVVGKITTFNLPHWPHRFPHFGCIYLGGGGVGGGGSDIRALSCLW